MSDGHCRRLRRRESALRGIVTESATLKPASCGAQVTEQAAKAWHSGTGLRAARHRKPAAVTQAGYAYCQLRITELSVQSRRGHGPRSNGPGIFRSRPVLPMLRVGRSGLRLFGSGLAQFCRCGIACRLAGILARLSHCPRASRSHRPRCREFSVMLVGALLAGLALQVEFAR